MFIFNKNVLTAKAAVQLAFKTHRHDPRFHLSVCSANTVGIWAASPFFMSPEWFSPEKQSALLEQSEPLSTQWQARGMDIQVLPLNLIHPNISLVLILIFKTWEKFWKTLNFNGPLEVFGNHSWGQALWTQSANTHIIILIWEKSPWNVFLIRVKTEPNEIIYSARAEECHLRVEMKENGEERSTSHLLGSRVKKQRASCFLSHSA